LANDHSSDTGVLHGTRISIFLDVTCEFIKKAYGAYRCRGMSVCHAKLVDVKNHGVQRVELTELVNLGFFSGNIGHIQWHQIGIEPSRFLSCRLLLPIGTTGIAKEVLAVCIESNQAQQKP